VLKLLGEDLPSTGEMSTVVQLLEIAKTRIFSAFTSGNMFSLPHTKCKRDEDIMRFYMKLVLVSYHKSDHEASILGAYYICRWLSFCLHRKVICRYTPVALSYYSGMLMYGFEIRNINEAHRLGNLALKCLNDSGSQAELPGKHCGFTCRIYFYFRQDLTYFYVLPFVNERNIVSDFILSDDSFFIAPTNTRFSLVYYGFVGVLFEPIQGES
jgi:hypothetical protein